MNIWFFVILLIAFALVLGPIGMLKPNPTQKRIEGLRMYARNSGVRFTMRRLPLLPTETEQSPAMPVYYLPPASKSNDFDEWILMRTSYSHEGNFYEEWDWQTSVRPQQEVLDNLRTYLPKLPASVIAISEGNLGVCVFWTEKEGKEILDLIIAMLHKLVREPTLRELS